MFKKLLTSACLCFIALWAGTATAREITFDLLSDKGPATHKSWPGKHLLLAFGYTTCPEICPTTLYEFAEAMKELKNPSAIQPIFVTIDPVSDDAKKLQEYVNFFDEHIVGLAGEMKNIRALVDQLGATFGYRLNGKRVDNPIKGSGYTVYTVKKGDTLYGIAKKNNMSLNDLLKMNGLTAKSTIHAGKKLKVK